MMPPMDSPNRTFTSPVPGERFSQPRPVLRWLAVLLAAAGAYVSFDLIRIGAGAAATNPLLRAVCSPSEQASDCDRVLGSRHAFWAVSNQPGAPRIPLAAIGLGYFLAIAAWQLFVGPTTRSRLLWSVPLLLFMAFGGLLSVGSMQIMASVLKRWCAGCVAVHAINAALIALTILGLPFRRSSSSGADHPSPRLALAALTCSGLLLVLPGLAMLTSHYSGLTGQLNRLYSGVISDPEYALWTYRRQPEVAVRLDDGAKGLGPDDAPLSVVAFIDIECSTCRAAHNMLETLRAAHPDKIRVTYRHYPLSSACNPALSREFHPLACLAAEIAAALLAADGPEAAQKFLHAAYQPQDSLDAAELDKLAGEIGVDPQKLAAARPAAQAAVQRDVALGQSLGLGNTAPAVFVNQRKLTYWQERKTWDALLAGLK
jgi:protein-disulfide isomerase/uncharacterized membrane protein